MAEKIMVAGAGKSGIEAARMLLELGASVLIYDENKELDVEKVKSTLPDVGEISFKLGVLTKNDIKDISLCVISPGIDLAKDFVKLLDDNNVAVWSEIQLAYQKELGKLVAITGTNGKTTTTALTGEILKKNYAETFVVGNIGVPYTTTALKTTENSVTVLETSSFQLETITDFRPHVSAILNITPDHLNRHKTMANYVAIKESITMNQTEDDFVVLNYDDPYLYDFGHSDRVKAKVIWFSSSTNLEEGYYLRDGSIFKKHDRVETKIINVDELILLGKHNYENVMAAIAMAECMRVPMSKICEALREFKGVEHRIEFVRERTGVKFYNDSKGTNPDAAINAIKAMPGKILLIGGGYDKGGEFDAWVESFGDKVKYLVLIGQTRDRIAECCKAHGFTNIMYAESLEEAVKVCVSYADMGDCVLLSPACASWDMFKCYEERGELFKQYVNEL